MNIRMTQYSHGAGCGCKIAPDTLEKILGPQQKNSFQNLLIGNESRDDAAAYDLGDGKVILSTTDFFMPIVDDPFTFGKIAAVNAISDIYAMGGKPLMALAIFGWPLKKIPLEAAQAVLEGGRAACLEAGIPLAGGHSIDSPEPIFGLAVTGQVDKSNLKSNDGATPGLNLYLTKPLGVGIITTAQKRGIVSDIDFSNACKSMTTLNLFGEIAATFPEIKAMTDVTGFSLLGHLKEMCQGSNTSAEIYFDQIPKLPGLDKYIEQECFPGAISKNWNSYKDNVIGVNDYRKAILCDPQTSGGLLIACETEAEDKMIKAAKELDVALTKIGQTTKKSQVLITVV